MVRKFWRNVSIGLILLRWPYDWFGKNLNFIELFANSLLHYFADDLDLCLNCKEKKVFCFGCQMIARLKKVRKIVANLIFFVVVVMFYNFFLPFFLVLTRHQIGGICLEVPKYNLAFLSYYNHQSALWFLTFFRLGKLCEYFCTLFMTSIYSSTIWLFHTRRSDSTEVLFVARGVALLLCHRIECHTTIPES